MNREQIVLRYVGSDSGEIGACCFCREDVRPFDGFVLFFEGSSDVVCLRCAKEEAPELSSLLQAREELDALRLALEDAESEAGDAEDRARSAEATINELTDEGESDDYTMGF